MSEYLNCFNNIFKCLSNNPIKSHKEFVNTQLITKIGMEMDKEAFEKVSNSLVNDQSFGILIADFTEIKNAFLNILKEPTFTPSPLFDELKEFEVTGIAKYNEEETIKLEKLILLCIFFCKNKDSLIDIIDKLDESIQNVLYDDILKNYITFEEDERVSIRNSIRNSFKPDQNQNNDRILYLENELAKEIENKNIIEKLKKELDSNKKENVNLKNKVNELEQKLIFSSKENESLKNKLNQVNKNEKNNNKNNNEILLIKQELEEKKKEIEKINEKYKNNENILEDKIEQLNREIEISREKEINFKDLQNKYEKLNKEYESIKLKAKNYDDLKKENELLIKNKNEQNNINKFSEYNFNNNFNNNNNINVEKYENEIKNLKNMIQEKNDEIEIYKNKFINEDNNNNNIDIENYKNEIKMLKNSIQDKNNEIENYKNQLISLQNKISNETNENNDKISNPFINKTSLKINKISIQSTEKNIENNLKENENKNNNLNEIKINKENEEQIKLMAEKIKNLQMELEKTKEAKDGIAAIYDKKKEEYENRIKKEFELISSAMCNLGFSYYSMKYSYEEKLKHNPNWLTKIRQKQYNGDY